MDKEQEGKIMCCSLTIFVPTASANFTTSLLSFVPASWHCASVQLAIYKSRHCASGQLTIYKGQHCASVQLNYYLQKSKLCISTTCYQQKSTLCIRTTYYLQRSTLCISTTCYQQKSTLCIRTTYYQQKLTLCIRTITINKSWHCASVRLTIYNSTYNLASSTFSVTHILLRQTLTTWYKKNPYPPPSTQEQNCFFNDEDGGNLSKHLLLLPAIHIQKNMGCIWHDLFRTTLTWGIWGWEGGGGGERVQQKKQKWDSIWPGPLRADSASTRADKTSSLLSLYFLSEVMRFWNIPNVMQSSQVKKN